MGGETRQFPVGLTRPRMPVPGPGCEPEGTGLVREKGSRITWRAKQSNKVERSAARGPRHGALGAGRSEDCQRPVGSSRRADRVRSATARGRRPGRRRPRVWRRWAQSRSGRRRPFDADMSPEPGWPKHNVEQFQDSERKGVPVRVLRARVPGGPIPKSEGGPKTERPRRI